MEWIILFILNWMLFLTLIEWKSFKTNVWSGIGLWILSLFHMNFTG